MGGCDKNKLQESTLKFHHRPFMFSIVGFVYSSIPKPRKTLIHFELQKWHMLFSIFIFCTI